MAHYSIYIGDTKTCEVSHKTEIPQALNIKEIREIEDKALKTVEYQQYMGAKNSFIGCGFMTIKLNT